jgi:hypothetical protein
MSWVTSRRNLYAIIAVLLGIVVAVYPYAYSNLLTQIGWSTVIHTSIGNYSTPLPPPYTLFNATQYFPSGTSIKVNVTYVGSCTNTSGCAISPEVCIYTVTSFKQIDWSKPIEQQLEQQATDCEGVKSYGYNSTTNQYAIIFTTILPQSTHYEFVSRLVTPCQPYQCPQYGTPTLTISQSSPLNSLQSYPDLNPQIIQVLCGIGVAFFTVAAIYENRRE